MLLIPFGMIFKSFKLRFSLIFLKFTLLNPSFFPLFLYHYLILRLTLMITAFLFPSRYFRNCSPSSFAVGPSVASC